MVIIRQGAEQVNLQHFFVKLCSLNGFQFSHQPQMPGATTKNSVPVCICVPYNSYVQMLQVWWPKKKLFLNILINFIIRIKTDA